MTLSISAKPIAFGMDGLSNPLSKGKNTVETESFNFPTVSPGAPKLESPFPITNVNWQVTDLCNLACPYCYSEEKYTQGASFEKGKELVDWLLEVGSKNRTHVHIGFFGGEPLIKWDLIKRVMLYAEGRSLKLKKKISFGMVTNGTLATEEVVETLKNHRFSIMISIDGPPDIHDKTRIYKNGKGSWDKLEKNIHRLVEAFPRIKARMTLSPENVEHFSRGMFFIHDELRISSISAHPVWELEWNEEKIDLLDRELGKIRERFCNDMRMGRAIGYDVFAKALRAIIRGKRKDYPCGVARSFAGIDPNGQIYSCHRLISYGRENLSFKLGSTADNILVSDRGDFNTYSLDKMYGCSGPGCDRCEARVICDGGCPAVFYAINGDIYHTVPAYRPILLIYKRHADLILEAFKSKPSTYFNNWIDRLISS